METIKTYLDNMFIGVPQTAEVRRLRDELYTNMGDKYNALKSEGKTENEAIGEVISEFGNIEELISELGIAKNVSVENEGAIVVTEHDAEGYAAACKKSGLFTAIGVALCVTCAAPLIFFAQYAEQVPEKEGVIVAFCMLYLFIAVTVAVGLFIAGGIDLNHYGYDKKVLAIPESLRMKLMEMKPSVDAEVNVTTLVSVMMYVLSPVPLVMCALLDTGDTSILGCVVVLLLVVAIATAMLIYKGMKKSAIDTLLQVEDSTVEKKRVEGDEVMSAVSGAFWTLVAATFLAVSFMTERWDISWIIWVIAAGVYGIIRAIFAAAKKN